MDAVLLLWDIQAHEAEIFVHNNQNFSSDYAESVIFLLQNAGILIKLYLIAQLVEE